MKILMVAAENDAIKGAKVGGVADVVRDIPVALSHLDHNVNVIIPDYGNYTKVYEFRTIASFYVPFSGHHEEVKLHEIFTDKNEVKVRQYILSHPLFSSGGIGRVYLDDPIIVHSLQMPLNTLYFVLQLYKHFMSNIYQNQMYYIYMTGIAHLLLCYVNIEHGINL